MSRDLFRSLLDFEKQGTLSSIKDILEHGADPNEVFDGDGVCAMHLAAGLGTDVLSLLLQHSGDPNSQSLDGTTPLHITASWGDTESLKLLLHSGANADVQDQDGKRALDLAIENEHDACAKELRIHTMSAMYEDSFFSPKFTLDEQTSEGTKYFPSPFSNYEDSVQDNSIDEEKIVRCLSDLDKSTIEPEILSSAYSKRITQKAYDYLGSGGRIQFDVTSPTTPIVVIKTTPPINDCPCPPRNPQSHLPSHAAYHQCHHHYHSCPGNGIKSSSMLDFTSFRRSPHCPSHSYQHFQSPSSCTSHQDHCITSSPLHVTKKSSSPRLNSPKVSSSSRPRNESLLKNHSSPQLNCSNNSFSQTINPSSAKNHRTKEEVHSYARNYKNVTPVNEISEGLNGVKINGHGLPNVPLDTELKSARTAKFVLSCNNDQFQIEGKAASYLSNDNSQQRMDPEKFEYATYSANSLSEKYTAATNGTKLEEEDLGIANISSSSSSCDSFLTCKSAGEEAFPQDIENNSNSQVLNSQKTVSYANSSQGSKHRWQAPLCPVLDVDLMTSDDSFIIQDTPISQRKVGMSKKKHNSHPLPPVHKVTTSIPSYNIQVASQDNNSKSLNMKKEKNVSAGQNTRLSNESLFSTVSAREYIYNDKERGITLIERHLPSECGSSIGRRSLDSVSSKISHGERSVDSQSTLIYDWRNVKSSSQSSQNSNDLNDTLTISTEDEGERSHPESDTEELVVIPEWIDDLTNEDVAKNLQKYGEIPGPVIPATRQAYLRRLASLESNPGLVKVCKNCPDYPCELRKALDGLFDWSSDLADLEAEMAKSFTTTNGRQWREGTVKSSFTYLLLDPRVTKNLPFRTKELSDVEAFKCFICSIFYIGKGKRARPYSHLYEAVSKLKKKEPKMSAKVKHILEIWESGGGVVSLHCFQSVIPVEAYTREACMMEAIGLHKVTNLKRGDFYGIACSWPMQKRRRLGVYLLKKVFSIFVAEGERQIYIPDLKG